MAEGVPMYWCSTPADGLAAPMLARRLVRRGDAKRAVSAGCADVTGTVVVCCVCDNELRCCSVVFFPPPEARKLDEATATARTLPMSDPELLRLSCLWGTSRVLPSALVPRLTRFVGRRMLELLLLLVLDADLLDADDVSAAVFDFVGEALVFC